MRKQKLRHWRAMVPEAAALMLGAVFVLGCDAERHDASIREPTESADTRAPPKAPTGLLLEVDGVALEAVKGWYQHGALTLYTGRWPDRSFDQKVVFYQLPDPPAAQAIRHPGGNPGACVGRMTYEKEDPSVNLATQWLQGCRYEIRIGSHNDYEAEIALTVDAAEPVRIHASGSLIAMTQGIKKIGGAIDRSFDHLDTIKYLTKAWIRKQHGPSVLADEPDACFMEHPSRKSGKPATRQTAACSFLFRDPEGALGIAKLWLEKRAGRWQEVGSAAPDQLLRAHPLRPPRPRPPYLFSPIAMQRFEREVYVPAGGFKRIREPTLATCGGGQREGQTGWCEVEYSLSAGDRELSTPATPACEAVTYLFEPAADGSWRIAQTLGTSQRFDHFKQQVVPREPREDCRTASTPSPR